jgi:hypothetical protein
MEDAYLLIHGQQTLSQGYSAAATAAVKRIAGHGDYKYIAAKCSTHMAKLGPPRRRAAQAQRLRWYAVSRCGTRLGQRCVLSHSVHIAPLDQCCAVCCAACTKLLLPA